MTYGNSLLYKMGIYVCDLSRQLRTIFRMFMFFGLLFHSSLFAIPIILRRIFEEKISQEENYFYFISPSYSIFSAKY